MCSGGLREEQEAIDFSGLLVEELILEDLIGEMTLKELSSGYCVLEDLPREELEAMDFLRFR